MKSTVEAVSKPVRVGNTAGRAFRQVHAPTPITTIDPIAPAPAIRTIVARIERIQADRGCGSYVFVNPSLQAFVLSEEKPAALHWVKDRIGWFVGFYRTVKVADPKIPAMHANVPDLTEDVLEQIEQMRAPA